MNSGPMNILAIETSTSHATVALLAREITQVERHDNLREHAQLILPMIDKLLQEANITCQDLDGIAFGAGPGSFTGLRVACSVAKGLAFAHNRPLFPVGTLKSIAYKAYKKMQNIQAETNVLAVMDARMQQLYWSYFEGSLTEVEIQVSSPEAIKLSGTAPFVIAGTGIEHYLAQFSKSMKARIRTQFEIFPDAEVMIELVKNNQIQPVSVLNAAPVYVRNQVTQGGGRG